MGTLNVVTVMGSNAGFREPESNKKKLEVLSEVAAEAKKMKADLVVLPAGYLVAEYEPEAKQKARAMAKRFKAKGIALIGGVDAVDAETVDGWGGKGSESAEEHVENGTLPFFGFFSPPKGRMEWWRQRSINSKHDKLLTDDLIGQSRAYEYKGLVLEVLMCGEIHSKKLRNQVRKHKSNLVIDIAHTGLGRGFDKIVPKLFKEEGRRKRRGVFLFARHGSPACVSPRLWRFVDNQELEEWPEENGFVPKIGDGELDGKSFWLRLAKTTVKKA